MLQDLRVFCAAIWNHWLPLMSGVFGVIAWGVTSMLEFVPASYLFLIFGAAGISISCFLAWRDERRAHSLLQSKVIDQKRKLALNRLIDDGEVRISEFSENQLDTLRTLATSANLQHWYRQTLAGLEQDYPEQWGHFSDLPSFGQGGVDRCEDQARNLLKRLKQLIEM